jgi:protein SCO1
MKLKNLLKKFKAEIMKPIKLIFFIMLFQASYGFGQPFTTGEVAINEHLDSIIPLNLQFSNEQNKNVKLADLIDRPTVLSFVYFDCPGLCSPLQDAISELIQSSDLVLGKDYKVLTISFNFRDNPEKARQKKANFTTKISKDKSANWIYLTGDSTNIVSILNSVGYKIKIAGMDYIHPTAIVIVSPKGKITRYLYGLQFLPFDFKMAVIEAQKGVSRPTINKVLQFCYAYDPEGRRYTLEVTKLAGTMILAMLVLFFSVLIFRKKTKPA